MKVGDLVKWHSTYNGKFKLGIVLSIEMIGEDAYDGNFTVLWKDGKKKACKRWQLFPLDGDTGWTFNACKKAISTV